MSAPLLPMPPISQFTEAPDSLASRGLPLLDSPPAQCAQAAPAAMTGVGGPQLYMGSGFGAGGFPRGILPEHISLLRPGIVPQGFSWPMGPLTERAAAVPALPAAAQQPGFMSSPPVPAQQPHPATPPQSMMRTALPPAVPQLQSVMRAALRPMAFKSIRSLMLRQQSTYVQQLSDLHTLSQVQGLLMCETPAEGDGIFTKPPQPQQQQPPWPRNSLFSSKAMRDREYDCIFPQLRRIVRYLGGQPNPPKTMHGGGGAMHGGGGFKHGGGGASSPPCPPPLPSLCPSGSPIPPLTLDVLRPCWAEDLPPQDDLVSGEGPEDCPSRRPSALQGGLKRTAWQRSHEGGLGIEGEGEAGRGEGASPQCQRRRGDSETEDVGSCSSHGDALDLLLQVIQVLY